MKCARKNEPRRSKHGTQCCRHDSHGKDVEALGSCCRPKSPSQIKRDGGKMRLRNQKDLSKDSCVPALCQCCCVELLCASADCAAA